MTMWLIAGLGNPGPTYALNRHNIGFIALDILLAQILPMASWRKKFQSECAEATMNGQKILLLKPQTFMNLSGDAVQAAAQFYKIPPEQILVLHDELDVPFGRVKVKRGGGAGGHNGLRSIDSHIGQDYYRLRLGIGHPGDKNKVSNYVLGDFSRAEQAALDDWLRAVATHLPLILKGDHGLFQTRLAPPKPPKTPAPAGNNNADKIALPDPDQSPRTGS